MYEHTNTQTHRPDEVCGAARRRGPAIHCVRHSLEPLPPVCMGEGTDEHRSSCASGCVIMPASRVCSREHTLENRECTSLQVHRHLRMEASTHHPDTHNTPTHIHLPNTHTTPTHTHLMHTPPTIHTHTHTSTPREPFPIRRRRPVVQPSVLGEHSPSVAQHVPVVSVAPDLSWRLESRLSASQMGVG